MTREQRELAHKIYNSREYKYADLLYYDEVKANYWIGACLNGDWIGLSRDMRVEEHTQQVKQFILEKDSPMIGIKYYTHHCPKCGGIVINPKDAVLDPLYEFNELKEDK